MLDYMVEKSSEGPKICHLEDKNPVSRFIRASFLPHLIMKPGFGVAKRCFTISVTQDEWLEEWSWPWKSGDDDVGFRYFINMF